MNSRAMNAYAYDYYDRLLLMQKVFDLASISARLFVGEFLNLTAVTEAWIGPNKLRVIL